MEYPVIANLGVYEGYLPKQQFYNTKEVKSFYNEHRHLSKQSKDSKMAEMLQQPIMAHTYREAGMPPELIAEYIESVLKLSEEKKNGMITDLYVIYGMSGVNMDENKQISSQNEWTALDEALVKHLSIPMKKFVAERIKTTKTTNRKCGLGNKIMRWFVKHPCSSKKFVSDYA